MQNKIEELKQQIESLKKELLALPSVSSKSEIDDLQHYLRISTELLKAVAALQVVQNVGEMPSSEQIKEDIQPVQPAVSSKESSKTETRNSAIMGNAEPPVHSEESYKNKVQDDASVEEQGKEIDVAEMLANNAINDLRSAFGLNERFYYTNELFDGDGQEFARAINEFNHLGSMEDAQRLIDAKYTTEFGWTEENEVVEAFVTIIKRRFS